MYQDFIEYQKYYKTEIGKIITKDISEKLNKFCYLYDHQKIAGFGFAHPFIKIDPNKKIDLIYYYSKKTGIHGGDIENFNKALVDEDQLPCEDSQFDHVFAIHYLENLNNFKQGLRELWRVTAPEGKLYIVVPNKKSLWYLNDKSPFSSGYGFSKFHIQNLIQENHFEIQFIERLIYYSNTNSKYLIKYQNFINRLGSLFFKYFNGVYLCVLKKRVYIKPLENQNYLKKVLTGAISKT
jgi:SAM-dependent methyltransferase